MYNIFLGLREEFFRWANGCGLVQGGVCKTLSCWSPRNYEKVLSPDTRSFAPTCIKPLLPAGLHSSPWVVQLLSLIVLMVEFALEKQAMCMSALRDIIYLLDK
jgi:hypothetical protein